MFKLREKLLWLLSLVSISLTACAQDSHFAQSNTFKKMNQRAAASAETGTQVATFGAGCFWCTEAQFQQLKGVTKVVSGYSGGKVANPTYKQVCTGETGHAEVTEVYYDPKVISYDELLAAFWTAHDPTQLNRQGHDVGTQYRSVIFYHNADQKRLAETYKQRLNAENAFGKPVVTEITPFKEFYPAENYHQDYYNQNGEQPYCQMVIRPKMDKFQAVFKDKLKSNAH